MYGLDDAGAELEAGRSGELGDTPGMAFPVQPVTAAMAAAASSFGRARAVPLAGLAWRDRIDELLEDLLCGQVGGLYRLLESI